MTKQELETKINDLELTLNAVELNAKCLKDDLIEANAKLANINKPKVSEHTMDQIYLAIEDAIDNFEFDNPDSYETDFTIDYDNRIALESIRFEDVSGIAECVNREVEKLFNVIPSEQND